MLGVCCWPCQHYGLLTLMTECNQGLIGGDIDLGEDADINLLMRSVNSGDFVETTDPLSCAEGGPGLRSTGKGYNAAQYST